jgi:putative peptide zinc metalloprotease protein
MNLTRALDVALPEIPARTMAERFPRMDPGTTFREHIEDGKPIFRIYVPCVGGMFKFPPQNWNLAKLFDGNKSYKQIAELYSQQSGVEYGEEQVRDFAADLEGVQFWYKTPQENNILLMQQTTEERRKKLQVRSKWSDLSMVVFPAFNPDPFLTWLYGKTSFIYTRWFTLLTIAAFGITLGIFTSHWSEVGRDSIEFYNFSKKTWGDILLLYLVSMVIVAIHETGHAHACKHYGARVPAMGLALVYLTPAFYTDTTEGVVMASRSQRFVIALAGIWAELIVCAIATPIWWGTPPDTVVHDVAYFMIMLTGLMSLILNWNPLIKLDGYHMLCEALGIPDLKEDSTAYVSAWVKRNVWGLPIEVPYVPKSRRVGFAVYALLSGTYSYLVLYVVARFAGNVVRNFSPEWGFVPEIAVGVLIFRSRIRLLVNFMKFVYLDKRDRILAWFTPRHSLAGVALVGAILTLPLMHESVTGRFLLEPIISAKVRARVPGTVTHIFAKEGQRVEQGAPLATLRNVPLQSDLEYMRAKLSMASQHVEAASLHYKDLGSALKEREQLTAQVEQLSRMSEVLQLNSPISGTVLTARLEDQAGSYLPEGTELLEVADLSSLRARIYISEYEMQRIQNGAKGRLQVEGRVKKWDALTLSIGVNSTEMDPKIRAKSDLKGMDSPHYYVVDLIVQNADGALKPGMIGMARVYGRRRSAAGLIWDSIHDFWGRKIW